MTSVSSDRAEAEDVAREQARLARDAALTVFVYVVIEPAPPDSVAEKTTGFIQAIESLGWRLEQMTTTRAQEFGPAVHTLVFRSTTTATRADSDSDSLTDRFAG